MLAIPQWLLDSTSAAKFAGNPAAPGWSDVATGIGHSMMDHYRGTLATGDHGVDPAPAQGAGVGHTMFDLLKAKGLNPVTPGHSSLGAQLGGGGMAAASVPGLPPPPQSGLPAPGPVSFMPNFKGLDPLMISRALSGGGM